MPDPTQGQPAKLTGDQIAANVEAMRGQHVSEPDIEAYGIAQGWFKPSTTDRPPPPDYAQQALGGIASLGRYIAGDAQTSARALTRYSGISDVVKAVGQEVSGSPVLRALASDPAVIAILAAHALRGTPSYAKSQDDINQAEASAGTIGKINSGIGLAVGLAPIASAIPSVLRSTMSPVSSVSAGAGSSGFPITKLGLARRMASSAIEPLRKLAYPAEAGLQGPMDDMAEVAQGQPAPMGLRGRPVATAHPWIGEAPSSAPAVESSPAGAISDADKQALIRNFGVDPDSPSLVAGEYRASVSPVRTLTPPPAVADAVKQSPVSTVLNSRAKAPTRSLSLNDLYNAEAQASDAARAGQVDQPQPDLLNLLQRSIENRSSRPPTP